MGDGVSFAAHVCLMAFEKGSLETGKTLGAVNRNYAIVAALYPEKKRGFDVVIYMG